eukprot:SAG11_NODE_6550_length_1290_cov_2.109152_1_plen_149_part_01
MRALLSLAPRPPRQSHSRSVQVHHWERTRATVWSLCAGCVVRRPATPCLGLRRGSRRPRQAGLAPTAGMGEALIPTAARALLCRAPRVQASGPCRTRDQSNQVRLGRLAPTNSRRHMCRHWSRAPRRQDSWQAHWRWRRRHVTTRISNR